MDEMAVGRIPDDGRLSLCCPSEHLRLFVAMVDGLLLNRRGNPRFQSDVSQPLPLTEPRVRRLTRVQRQTGTAWCSTKRAIRTMPKGCMVSPARATCSRTRQMKER
jgi:hypothetical protein